jgi:hypothetical protein
MAEVPTKRKDHGETESQQAGGVAQVLERQPSGQGVHSLNPPTTLNKFARGCGSSGRTPA